MVTHSCVHRAVCIKCTTTLSIYLVSLWRMNLADYFIYFILSPILLFFLLILCAMRLFCALIMKNVSRCACNHILRYDYYVSEMIIREDLSHICAMIYTNTYIEYNGLNLAVGNKYKPMIMFFIMIINCLPILSTHFLSLCFSQFNALIDAHFCWNRKISIFNKLIEFVFFTTIPKRQIFQ